MQNYYIHKIILIFYFLLFKQLYKQSLEKYII